MPPERTILSAPPLTVDLADERTFLNGQPIELGPKPFALLVAIMQAQQRLVTKEELLETVWEGRFVTEAVLTTAMRDLRKALRDDARAPTFIGTAHGRGYRFLKPVSVEARTAEATPAPRGAQHLARPPGALLPVPLVMAGVFLIAIAVLALLAAPSNPRQADIATASIAVLPFADLSSAEGRSHFSEGAAEEILEALADMEGLSVAPRAASFRYVQADAAPADVARALGVQYLLRGTVRAENGSLQVQVRLLDGASGREAWTHTYERPLSVQNLFAIQEEIAQAVARELRLGFGGEMRAFDAAGTQDLQAYDYYLRGRELFLARSDLPRAATLARAATEADPAFAQAWELLAASTFAAQGGRVTAEAENAVATALRLNPNLSLAHAIRGVMGNVNPPYDWNATIGDLERAIELDPRNATAHLWLGTEMHKLGYLERSQTLLERCLALDPAYDRCREHLIWVLHMRGETNRAIAEYRTQIRNGAHIDDTTLLSAMLARGLDDDARRVAASVASDAPMPALVFEAMGPHASADRAGARAALRGWIEHVRYRRDVYSVIVGLEAYDLLLVEQGSNFALWLPEYPEFRRSEAFNAFVRTMGIDDYWRMHGFPPQCRAVGASEFSCV